MKQYQFELWPECNNNCTFCYLGEFKKHTDEVIKLKNIQTAINKIKNPTFLIDYECLAFIGGEFFQGQLNTLKVKEAFMNLMSLCNDLLNENKIKEVWINCTLTIGDQKDLFETLKLFSNIEKVWILTSYDTKGRFHSTKMKENWINNLQKIRNLYPTIKINITSILTSDFIQHYIDNDLDLLAISKSIKASLFWKPPCPIFKKGNDEYSKEEVNKMIPNFFPSRQLFKDFLLIYANRESDLQYDLLFSMNLRADCLERLNGDTSTTMIRLKDKSQEVFSEEQKDLLHKCGHSSEYCIYIDSDACCICDKEEIRNLVFNEF